MQKMFETYKNIYFIGIGGIGMSALARWYNHQGYFVAGYDRNITQLSKELEAEGIQIHYEDSIENIPDEIQKNAKENTLVVYTPAVPAQHQELTFFKESGFTIKKRAEVLGMLTAGHYTIAIAGTHGKTTTSSMLAHILKSNDLPCNSFLGGILKNYQSNLLLADPSSQKTLMLTEADEYDKSFLQLNPDIAVVLSTDADHLDIYDHAGHVEEAYTAFVKKTKQNGKIFLKKDINLDLRALDASVSVKYFAMNQVCDYFAENIRIEEDFFYFDFISSKGKIEHVKLQVPGFHNVENAVLAMAVAQNMGIEDAQIKKAIESYLGVRRRFDYIVRGNPVYIDDYAHHPTEIRAFLQSVRALYPKKKITAVFQPHLFSRTRDFMEGFAESLSLADELILLDIYPARELPIEGITSGKLLEKVSLDEKKLVTKDQLVEELRERNLEILLTIGAGDIDQLINELKDMIYAKQNTTVA